jgi:hypothetical protein
MLLFPIIEGTYLLTLGLSVGLIFVTGLRLMGTAFRNQTMSSVMNRLLPWSLTGFAIMVVSGGLILWSEAASLYQSVWFRWKIVFLLLAALNALIFHATICRRMYEWGRDWPPSRAASMAGWISLIVWVLVIGAGRATAYKL